MVAADRVRRLLAELDHRRESLNAIAATPADAYAGERALAGRYLVQVSAQICIDLANHVIASSGWRAPDTFRDAFTVLEEHTVIEPALAERMRALAGLRNLLVHVYEEVDDGLVHEAISSGLEDIAAFGQAVARLAVAE